MRSGFLSRLLLIALFVVLAGCRSNTANDNNAHDAEEGVVLVLPTLNPPALDGRPLRVVATTSIIGDVVQQIGGDAIELSTLMGPGDDSHAFQATPGTLRQIETADVVFVNGWDLEAALLAPLRSATQTQVVPISAGFTPRTLDADEADHAEAEAHAHGAADPHVWFSIDALRRWANNAADVLAALDPAHAATYAANRDAYLGALDDLAAYMDAQFARIPAERRKVVTNHESLGYLADGYGLEVIGTVIPALSTAAEPSAAELGELVRRMAEAGVCTVFTETTAGPRLAATIEAELRDCVDVRVVPLYVENIGPPGSGADSTLAMLRYNTDAIVAALTR